MTKANPQKDFPTECEQGRRACLSSVSQEDAPYDTDSKQLEAWQAGFDAAEGEAARNEMMEPATPPSGPANARRLSRLFA